MDTSLRSTRLWDNEKTLEFIRAIHSRRLLWDTKVEDYKNRSLKRQAWVEISEEFGISRKAAANKFRSLRTQFNAEAKCAQERTIKWFAFKALSFLLSAKDPNAAKKDEISRQLIEKLYPDIRPTASRRRGQTLARSQSPPTSPSRTYSEKRRKCNDEPEQKHQQIKQQIDEEDGEEGYEFQGVTFEKIAAENEMTENQSQKMLPFGKHVNEKLLSYNNTVRSHVEYKIATILYKADMGYYDTPVTHSHSAAPHNSRAYNSVETARRTNNISFITAASKSEKMDLSDSIIDSEEYISETNPIASPITDHEDEEF